MSKIIDDIKSKAKKLNKKIVLPDATDERAIQAAKIIVEEKIAKIVLVGKESIINSKAKELNVALNDIEVIDPNKSERMDDFVNIYCELRKSKGVTSEQAKETMSNSLFFGAMLVREGLVDGSVAGSLSTTSDVIRAGIQIIGTPPDINLVSSFFLMVLPHVNYFYADCSVVPNPTQEQLADIAITTADNYKKLIGEEPRVAMLSFSTKGSAIHPRVDKVRKATMLVKQKRPDLLIDGELQADAALVPSVCKKKAPESPIEGKANVLIFPDLDAGNIAYKLTQRLAGAEAYGPIIQGLKKPFYDLSRGCSVDDIVNMVAINVVAGAF